jgi:hypothetical protein
MPPPAWIATTPPIALPLAPLLAEPTQPLVVGLLLAWAWACLVLLPRFALLVVAGDLVAAALRGSLSPVSLALRLMALVATGAALLLLAKGVSRQLRRSSTDPEESC